MEPMTQRSSVVIVDKSFMSIFRVVGPKKNRSLSHKSSKMWLRCSRKPCPLCGKAGIRPLAFTDATGVLHMSRCRLQVNRGLCVRDDVMPPGVALGRLSFAVWRIEHLRSRCTVASCRWNRTYVFPTLRRLLELLRVKRSRCEHTFLWGCVACQSLLMVSFLCLLANLDSKWILKRVNFSTSHTRELEE